MNILSIASLIICVTLAIYASISDICTERIPNRALVAALIPAVTIDAVQFAFLTQGLLLPFAASVVIACIVSIVLFYSNTWAGGDCKFACVLVLSYPAQCYIELPDVPITATLPVAIGAAFALGSIYLLALLVVDLAKGRLKLQMKSIAQSFVDFAQSYLCALSCIAALFLLNTHVIQPHVQLSPVVLASLGFCCIWLLSGVGLLKSWVLLLLLLGVDIVASLVLQTVPLGGNPFRYLFVLAVMLLRVVVSQRNVQTVRVEDIRSGMILTTASSLLFINSKVEGLPNISTEDLRSRLTEEEARSILEWGRGNPGFGTIEVVRKMPFAIFISLGFAVYFIVWSVA